MCLRIVVWQAAQRGRRDRREALERRRRRALAREEERRSRKQARQGGAAQSIQAPGVRSRGICRGVCMLYQPDAL